MHTTNLNNSEQMNPNFVRFLTNAKEEQNFLDADMPLKHSKTNTRNCKRKGLNSSLDKFQRKGQDQKYTKIQWLPRESVRTSMDTKMTPNNCKFHTQVLIITAFILTLKL